MVDEEFHAFTDAFPLLRIFLAPLVCTLVLLESINHLADDVQPFRIAFVFSMLFNDVAQCTAVWPFFCLQESPKMVGDNPCQTCVQRPYVFIRYFRISLVAFGFPHLNRIKLYTYLIINFIKLQYLRIDTIKFPQFIL